MANGTQTLGADSRPNNDLNQSFRSERATVLVLAIVGCAIACYLTGYQVGLVAAPWDPIFGTASSERVLTSALTRALPVPDAGLGAFGYLVEIVLVSIGGAHRWHVHPRVVLLYGLVVLGMALVSLALILTQAFVVHSGCTLCLTSAVISLVNAAFARGEVWASLGLVRGTTVPPDTRSRTARPSSWRNAA